MKLVVPWMCVAVLLTVVAGFYRNNVRQQEELAAVRREHEELKAVSAKATRHGDPVQVEELARLRKENEELHRLRNEVRQWREEKPKPSKTAAPAPGASPPGQLQQLLAENERLRAENQHLLAANQAQQLRAQSPDQAQANACMNQLRVIQGAKEQWALENKKPFGALPKPTDLAPYLKDNALPTCPAGGFYTLNPIGAEPACNISGHAMSRE
jgi:hypothetical protein